MDVNPIGGFTEPTPTSYGSQNLGRFEFLRLLVAQLNNQDPLEPLENAEFVSQVAQFSSLDELVKIRQLTETSMAILTQMLAAAPPEDAEGGEGTDEVAEPTPVDNPGA